MNLIYSGGVPSALYSLSPQILPSEPLPTCNLLVEEIYPYFSGKGAAQGGRTCPRALSGTRSSFWDIHSFT